MINDVKKVLINQEQLEQKVEELSQRIINDYKNKKLVFIVILKGAAMFASDLFKKINTFCELDYMVVSSYGSGTVSSGVINIKKDISVDIKGKDVVIIEDIVDTGITLSKLKEVLYKREPNSIEICACVTKPSRRETDINVKYLGFEVENEFIIGYGLDYNEKYRNLPFIGVLKESVYEK